MYVCITCCCDYNPGPTAASTLGRFSAKYPLMSNSVVAPWDFREGARVKILGEVRCSRRGRGGGNVYMRARLMRGTTDQSTRTDRKHGDVALSSWHFHISQTYRHHTQRRSRHRAALRSRSDPGMCLRMNSLYPYMRASNQSEKVSLLGRLMGAVACIHR